MESIHKYLLCLDGPVLGIEYSFNEIPDHFEKFIYNENFVTAYKNVYPHVSNYEFQTQFE